MPLSTYPCSLQQTKTTWLGRNLVLLPTRLTILTRSKLVLSMITLLKSLHRFASILASRRSNTWRVWGQRRFLATSSRAISRHYQSYAPQVKVDRSSTILTMGVSCWKLSPVTSSKWWKPCSGITTSTSPKRTLTHWFAEPSVYTKWSFIGSEARWSRKFTSVSWTTSSKRRKRLTWDMIWRAQRMGGRQ